MADRKDGETDQGEVGEIVDLVKTYVRQETVGPLKGLGRKIGVGVAGALLVGMGVFFLAIGLLRLLQDKADWASSGSWTWAAYLIVIAFCGLVTVLALMRIKKIEKELN